MNATLDHAIAAHRAGLNVLPPRQDGTKAPDAVHWADRQATMATEDEIRAWYADDRRTGLGLVCGPVSGGLEMLEFEGRAVEDGLHVEFMEAANAAGLGPLVERIVNGYLEETPGGGLHLLLRCDEVEGNQKLARRPATVEELADNPDDRIKVLIETRGRGGFVIVAPSNGQVHPTGRPWRLSSGGFSTIATVTPEERAEVLRLARTFDRMPKADYHPASRRPDVRRGEGIGERPGDEFSAKTTWPEILEPHGWAYLFTASDGNQHWRRPGKDMGTSATIADNGDGPLYVFSSSTVFEPETAYSRFAAYAVLNHGNDLSAAARELAARGYGKRPDLTTGDPGRKREVSNRPEEPDPAAPDVPPDDADDGPVPTPSAPVSAQLAALTVRWVTDVLREPPAQPAVLVDGLLRAGEMCVLGALRALGKSWWAMNLATMLGRGEGLFCGQLRIRRPARVLIAQGELDDWGSWERWAKLCGTDGPPDGVAESFDRWRLRVISRRSGAHADGMSTSDEWMEATLDERVEAAIEAHGFDVLIIDPWRVYFAGAENSNDEVEAGLERLRGLAMRTGVAIVILHHLGKASEAREPEDLWRGASRLADWASTRVTMLPHYTEKQALDQGMTRQQSRRYVDLKFLRRAEPTEDFSIVWRPETGWWERWANPAESADARRVILNPVDVANICRKSGGDWPSTKAAAEALGVAQATAGRLLADAVRTGYLVSYPGPRGAAGHRLPEEGECLI